MLNPVLPFLTDTEENIRSIAALAHKADARFIHTYMGMTMRDRQREHYYQKLDELFPGMKERYQKQFGSYYMCKTPNRKELSALLRRECKAYGILYRMDQIIHAYKKQKQLDEQMALF